MRNEAIAALIARAFSDEGKWPIKAERPILQALNTWIALRESDRSAIKRVANWRDKRREYRIDPLPERIADAWAHYLYGEDPTVTPPDESDAENYTRIVNENELPAELERGATLCVSEGEVWSRIYTEPNVASVPLLEWVSRSVVFPLWVGRRLLAAAVVTELPVGDDKVVYRHFECHAYGIVENVLFAGGPETLGQEVDLEAHPATAGMATEWQHNLPGLLLDRIPNRLRKDPTIGVSDFAGILDTILDLNEATVIGAHNARLTARKRVVVSRSAATPATQRNDLELTPEEGGVGSIVSARNTAYFDSSEEVFVEDPLDAELGNAAKDPFKVIEYSFDADKLIAWKRHLTEEALTRVGLTPQYVGAITDASDGYAVSGTALRLRLIPTDKTGRGKGRYWDDAIPKRLRMMALVDNLATTNGGFGRPYNDLVDPPVVERQPGLPADDLEDAQRHQALLGAGAESRRQAILELHPDWPEDKVDEELDAIKGDRSSAAPGAGLGLGLA